MNLPRKVPYATLALAVLITLIQGIRLLSEDQNHLVWSNLNVLRWDLLYAQPWRILTSPFLHHNPFHYLGNLIFLLLFGIQIERNHGRGYLLAVFFGSMVTGYVIWINLAHDWIIGISGGVSGLFGFSLIANRLAPWWKTLTHRPLHILYSLNLIWAVIVDTAGWVPFEVAHLNHVTGVLYGLAFGVVFLLMSPETRWRWVVIALPLVLFASQLYSPWQVEWQMVNRQPMLVSSTVDCRLHSSEQDVYTPAPITFVNESAKPVGYYWLDYEGNAIFYGWLNSNDSHDLDSFIGHPWCFVDVESGEAIQAAIVMEPNQSIIIP